MTMDKKNADFEIKERIQFDISQIQKDIVSILETDGEIKNNNDRFKFTTHSATSSQLIYDFPLSWIGEEEVAESVCLYPQLVESIEPIIIELEKFYDGKRGRVLLVNLPGQRNIPEHSDSGFYLWTVHRNHIPVVTNEKIYFSVGETTISMKEGMCYEINNAKMHSVKNESDDDRYQLIVDIIPSDNEWKVVE
jgi:thiol-disulfide isomerase/thioredoxin